MIDKKPKTYNEIIRLKKCYTLADYYIDVTENMFNEIYDFLNQDSKNTIVANRENIFLVDSNSKIVKTFKATPKNSSFDQININDDKFSVTPHYDPSSSSSSGGSSSNNNNNNNNNNNS